MKPFSKNDRITIQAMHSIGYSNRAITRELNCSPSTIVYDQKRHCIPLHWQCETIQSCPRTNAIDANAAVRACFFAEASSSHQLCFPGFHKRGWSVGYALAEGTFPKDQVGSTKTLYNYVDLVLMDIQSIDLPEKVKRNTKARRIRANKRVLGRNIDERSPRIDNRKDFGHWECDLVLGHKTKDDDVLLTPCERKTRRFFMIRIEDKTSTSVMKAFDKLREFYGPKWNKIFKSITTDNGSEFVDLSNLEQVS